MKYDLHDMVSGDSKSPTGGPFWQDPEEALAYLRRWHVPPRTREDFQILDEDDQEWLEPEPPPERADPQGVDGPARPSGRRRRRLTLLARIIHFLYRYLKRKGIGPLEKVLYAVVMLAIVAILLLDHQSELFRIAFAVLGLGSIGLGLLSIYGELINNVINNQKLDRRKILLASFCIAVFCGLLLLNRF